VIEIAHFNSVRLSIDKHVSNTSGSGNNSFSRCDAKEDITNDMICPYDKCWIMLILLF